MSTASDIVARLQKRCTLRQCEKGFRFEHLSDVLIILNTALSPRYLPRLRRVFLMNINPVLCLAGIAYDEILLRLAKKGRRLNSRESVVITGSGFAVEQVARTVAGKLLIGERVRFELAHVERRGHARQLDAQKEVQKLKELQTGDSNEARVQWYQGLAREKIRECSRCLAVPSGDMPRYTLLPQPCTKDIPWFMFCMEFFVDNGGKTEKARTELLCMQAFLDSQSIEKMAPESSGRDLPVPGMVSLDRAYNESMWSLCNQFRARLQDDADVKRLGRRVSAAYVAVDTVGYTKIDGIDKQKEHVRALNLAIHEALNVARIHSGHCILHPTGDGCIVAILQGVDDIVRACERALEFAKALQDVWWRQAGEPSLRIGMACGHDEVISDINGSLGLLGAGINASARICAIGAERHIVVLKEIVLHLGEYNQFSKSNFRALVKGKEWSFHIYEPDSSAEQPPWLNTTVLEGWTHATP